MFAVALSTYCAVWLLSAGNQVYESTLHVDDDDIGHFTGSLLTELMVTISAGRISTFRNERHSHGASYEDGGEIERGERGMA